MKTIEERVIKEEAEFHASRFITDSQWESQNRKESFTYGAKWGAAEQKAIMLEEASRGFSEWIKSEPYKVSDPSLLTDKVLKQMEMIWTAATLSKMKEFEELKKDLEHMTTLYINQIQSEHDDAVNVIRKKHNLESRQQKEGYV